MKKYSSPFKKAALINKINDLITIKAENKFLIHIKHIIKYFNDRANEDILGNTTSNSFLIWQYNSFWGGLFYPIIYARIFEEDNSTALELKTKLNPLGKLISILFFAAIIIGTILSNYVVINNKIYFDYKIIMLGIAVSILFQSLPLAAYNVTRFQTIKFIEKYLGLEKILFKNISS
jgi:hypothetical protein